MKWLGKDLILEGLKQLSRKDVQEKLWLSDGSTEVSSFTEAVEILFTDSALGLALEEGSTGYSRVVENKFKELDMKLSKIKRKRPSIEIINDPAMDEVRALATEILLKLKD